MTAKATEIGDSAPNSPEEMSGMVETGAAAPDPMAAAPQNLTSLTQRQSVGPAGRIPPRQGPMKPGPM